MKRNRRLIKIKRYRRNPVNKKSEIIHESSEEKLLNKLSKIHEKNHEWLMYFEEFMRRIVEKEILIFSINYCSNKDVYIPDKNINYIFVVPKKDYASMNIKELKEHFDASFFRFWLDKDKPPLVFDFVSSFIKHIGKEWLYYDQIGDLIEYYLNSGYHEYYHILNTNTIFIDIDTKYF